MAAPSQQRTCTHCSQCEAVLGQQTGHLPRAPALALPQNESRAERHPFCVGGGDQSRSDTTTQGHEGKGLHGVLSSVVTPKGTISYLYFNV